MAFRAPLQRASALGLRGIRICLQVTQSAFCLKIGQRAKTISGLVPTRSDASRIRVCRKTALGDGFINRSTAFSGLCHGLENIFRRGFCPLFRSAHARPSLSIRWKDFPGRMRLGWNSAARAERSFGLPGFQGEGRLRYVRTLYRNRAFPPQVIGAQRRAN